MAKCMHRNSRHICVIAVLSVIAQSLKEATTEHQQPTPSTTKHPESNTFPMTTDCPICEECETPTSVIDCPVCPTAETTVCPVCEDCSKIQATSENPICEPCPKCPEINLKSAYNFCEPCPADDCTKCKLDLKAASPVPEPCPTEGAPCDCPDVESSDNKSTCPKCPECLTLDVKTACSMCQSAICPKCDCAYPTQAPFSSKCPEQECPTNAQYAECPKHECLPQPPCAECPECKFPQQLPYTERTFLKPHEQGTPAHEIGNVPQNDISCPECDISKANNLVYSETDNIIDAPASNDTVNVANSNNKDYYDSSNKRINNKRILTSEENTSNTQNGDK